MLTGDQNLGRTTTSRRSWDKDLLQIPSFYGRLVYLSGLRNPDTGLYEHYGFEERGHADLSDFLARTHESLFQAWIRLPLEKKKSDIETYMAGIGQVSIADLVDAWVRLTPYRNLVPGSIQGPERSRHISDVEVILGLLRNVYGVASPDPSA